VDGDGREVLLGQELSKSGTSLHRLDEDDDLEEIKLIFEWPIPKHNNNLRDFERAKFIQDHFDTSVTGEILRKT